MFPLRKERDPHFLCAVLGTNGDALVPALLCGQLQRLPGLQWASPAVWFYIFGSIFQGGVWRPANKSLLPPWKFPTMELLKPPVTLLPPHYEKQLSGGQAGGRAAEIPG